MYNYFMDKFILWVKNNKQFSAFAAFVLLLSMGIAVYVAIEYGVKNTKDDGGFVEIVGKPAPGAYEGTVSSPSFSGGDMKSVDKEQQGTVVNESIKIIQDGRFQYVEDPPAKSPMEALQNMAGGGKGGKKKMVPEYLPKSALRPAGQNTGIYARSNVSASSQSGGVPSMDAGKDASQSGISMPSVPAGYKTFEDSAVWEAFVQTHKEGGYPKVDFSSQSAVILMSLSDFPPGIFKIVSTAKEKNRLLIKYRVDPFEMSAENPEAKPHAYSAAAIEKSDLPIELEQVP